MVKLSSIHTSKNLNKVNIYKFFRFKNFRKKNFRVITKKKPSFLYKAYSYNKYTSSRLYNNVGISDYVEQVVEKLKKTLHNFLQYSGWGNGYIFSSVNKLISAMKYLKPFGTYTFNHFYVSNQLFNQIPNILMMSFRRKRLFSSIQSLTSVTYSNSSLGMFSVYLNKGKAFTKNKSNYILMASFIRKLIVYSSIKDIYLIVKHIPIYLNELIGTINKQSINFYKDPFSGKLINESGTKNEFYFNIFFFFNNKPYGFVKTRKKGRIKRKITKRLVKLNRIVD
jgi:hypothetical protein